MFCFRFFFFFTCTGAVVYPKALPPLGFSRRDHPSLHDKTDIFWGVSPCQSKGHKLYALRPNTDIQAWPKDSNKSHNSVLCSRPPSRSMAWLSIYYIYIYTCIYGIYIYFLNDFFFVVTNKNLCKNSAVEKVRVRVRVRKKKRIFFLWRSIGGKTTYIHTQRTKKNPIPPCFCSVFSFFSSPPPSVLWHHFF